MNIYIWVHFIKFQSLPFKELTASNLVFSMFYKRIALTPLCANIETVHSVKFVEKYR